MARTRKKAGPARKRPGGSVDNYLHALLLLTNHGQPAETGDLAARVGVSPASASQMLKKLSEAGLVRLEPYKGAELSTEGLHRALRIVRRHRLLELFLHKVVGFDLDELHLRATAIQGAVDESFEEKLDALLGSPKVDPHGRPIPGKNATWPKLGDSPLTTLPPGTAGVVTRILTDQAEAIEYLRELGIAAGTRLALEGISPFEGPVAVRVGGATVHLGRRLAQAIHMADEPATAAPPPAKESTRRS
jgi:DtxR family transcriptional regulator, Mn-dependent transcriptional regulator